MSLRALLVDDEPRARNRLRRLLADHPDVVVVGEASTGGEAVAQTLTLRPNLVFLDVRMPGVDGMEAARTLRRNLAEADRPRIVFTTAWAEHAVEAFSVEGVDYLLKPIERDRLAEALRRVRRGVGPAPLLLEEPAARPSSDDVLAAHRAGRTVRLRFGDVAAVIVEDTIAFAHTLDGRFHLNSSLHEVEARLPSPPFIRVSRGSILNLDHVAYLRPGASGTFIAVLRAPIELEVAVSRRRAKRVRAWMGE